MKLQGIFGKGSGKLGNAVFAVSGGEQLVKEYNPRVSNPNTPAQVEQRAKFKLLSQLAAVFSPAMAFRKMGLVSARNQFVSKNFGIAEYDEGKAKFDLEKVRLTGGIGYCPEVKVDDSQEGVYGVELVSAAPENIKGMVYVTLSQDNGYKLILEDVKVITEAGVGSTFPGTLKIGELLTVVYAYGIVAAGGDSGFDYDDLMAGVQDLEAWVAIDKLSKNASISFTDTRFMDI